MNTIKRILSLSPHPDDIELGAGGLIAKKIGKGIEVYVVVFSKCIESLPPGAEENILIEEFNKSMSKLGVLNENRFDFNFPVRRFSEYRQDILEELIKLRTLLSPDLILLPASADHHQDHKVIYEEGVRAFLRSSSILGYELPWNIRSFDVQHIVELSEENFENKITAIQEYKSQVEIGRSYFSKNFIRGLAETRGIQGGFKLAEAFEVIRIYG